MISRFFIRSVCVLLLSLDLVSCKDLAGTQPLPAGTISPGSFQTAAGAAAAAVAARLAFQSALAAFIPSAGLMTDELYSAQIGINPVEINYSGDYELVDARMLDQGYDWNHGETVGPHTDQVYTQLQGVRTLTGQAIGSLATYAPTTSANERGELYALMGYAEVMLADLFCSGIPLSTLDFQGNYTYRPGSTTAQVYQHAIALFDTAMTLGADSAPVVSLAKVGQGRAYLALGEYAAAGQAISGVPITFQYVDSIQGCFPAGTCPNSSNLSAIQIVDHLSFDEGYSVSDQEGGTGLPFLSSGDPRTLSDSIGVIDYYLSSSNSDLVTTVYSPAKYPANGVDVIVVASGLEAQLIAAEAQLNAGNATGAFTTLNTLRQQNAQTAGKLPTLNDPGTFGAEVDTLFTERAAWLFVTGQRQGDLRRLVRQYGKQQNVTMVANRYPSGSYPGIGAYGTFIDAPIPASELTNPLFQGCLSRD